MNIISSILIAFAVLLSVLTFFALISWLVKGGVSVIFPGLGLVVSLSAIIVLLLIFQIVLVVLAGAIKPPQMDSEMPDNQPYNSSQY